jgi:hypothetical protein
LPFASSWCYSLATIRQNNDKSLQQNQTYATSNLIPNAFQLTFDDPTEHGKRKHDDSHPHCLPLDPMPIEYLSVKSERNRFERSQQLTGRGLFSLLSGGGLLSLGLSRLVLLRGSLLDVVAIARGPQGQVVTEKLHDESGVPVALFAQGVELSNSVVEGLLSEVASAVGRVEDLVVEDREVEGQTQPDRVGWGELGLCDVGSVLYGKRSAQPPKHSISETTNLVGLVGGLGGLLPLIARGELGEVTVVVTLPGWLSAGNR